MSFRSGPVVLGTTDTDIFECPATLDGAAVLGIANVDSVTRTYTIKFYKAATATTRTIASGVEIAANTARKFPAPFALQEGDKIIGSASAGSAIVVTPTVALGDAAPAAKGFEGKGVYSAGATYARNDLVRVDSEGSYLSLVDDNIGNTPSSSPSQWMLYAADGADGDDGDQGPPGVGGSPSQPQGRITLTSGSPVMSLSVSGATTVYYCPDIGRMVPLFDGTSFSMVDIEGELSQATIDTTKSPAAVAASKNYDKFVWDDSGTIRATRGPAWSTDTERGTGASTTELERVQGVLVNKYAITNGPAANRGTYVGTIRSNASSTIDFILGGTGAGGTAAVLGVWNMYNRRQVAVNVADNSSNFTYSSSSVVPYNNSGTGSGLNMRASYVLGLAEDHVDAIMLFRAQVTPTATGIGHIFGGLAADSASAFDKRGSIMNPAITGSGGNIQLSIAIPNSYRGQMGWHYIQALMQGDSSTSCTVIPDSGASNGLNVDLMM